MKNGERMLLVVLSLTNEALAKLGPRSLIVADLRSRLGRILLLSARSKTPRLLLVIILEPDVAIGQELTWFGALN